MPRFAFQAAPFLSERGRPPCLQQENSAHWGVAHTTRNLFTAALSLIFFLMLLSTFSALITKASGERTKEDSEGGGGAKDGICCAKRHFTPSSNF